MAAKCRALRQCRQLPGSLLAASALLLPAASAAQSLTISPVNIEIPAGQSSVAITVTNDSKVPTTYQVRPHLWSQDAEGNDSLVPTTEVLISPPLGTIPPQASQTIRLVLRRRPVATELSYRIILDQLPGAAVEGAARMVLRFSIPVFAPAAEKQAPLISWLVESANGQNVLVAVNRGLQHAKLWEMAITAAGGAPMTFESTGPQYVLAGTTHRWPFAPRKGGTSPGGPYTLSASSDQGDIKEAVAVNDVQ